MPSPTIEAAFGNDLVARQANALLARLRANQPLADYFEQGSGIGELESEFLLSIDGRLSIKAPFLGVAIGPVNQPRIATGNTLELAAAFDLFLITAMPTAVGTRQWLRSRVFGAICRELSIDGGVLYDVDDSSKLLCDALVRFERLDFRGQLQGTNLIATTLRVVYRADFDAVSGEFNS